MICVEDKTKRRKEKKTEEKKENKTEKARFLLSDMTLHVVYGERKNNNLDYKKASRLSSRATQGRGTKCCRTRG